MKSFLLYCKKFKNLDYILIYDSLYLSGNIVYLPIVEQPFFFKVKVSDTLLIFNKLDNVFKNFFFDFSCLFTYNFVSIKKIDLSRAFFSLYYVLGLTYCVKRDILNAVLKKARSYWKDRNIVFPKEIRMSQILNLRRSNRKLLKNTGNYYNKNLLYNLTLISEVDIKYFNIREMFYQAIEKGGARFVFGVNLLPNILRFKTLFKNDINFPFSFIFYRWIYIFFNRTLNKAIVSFISIYKKLEKYIYSYIQSFKNSFFNKEFLKYIVSFTRKKKMNLYGHKKLSFLYESIFSFFKKYFWPNRIFFDWIRKNLSNFSAKNSKKFLRFVTFFLKIKKFIKIRHLIRNLKFLKVHLGSKKFKYFVKKKKFKNLKRIVLHRLASKNFGTSENFIFNKNKNRFVNFSKVFMILFQKYKYLHKTNSFFSSKFFKMNHRFKNLKVKNLSKNLMIDKLAFLKRLLRKMNYSEGFCYFNGLRIKVTKNLLKYLLVLKKYSGLKNRGSSWLKLFRNFNSRNFFNILTIYYRYKRVSSDANMSKKNVDKARFFSLRNKIKSYGSFSKKISKYKHFYFSSQSYFLFTKLNLLARKKYNSSFYSSKILKNIYSSSSIGKNSWIFVKVLSELYGLDRSSLRSASILDNFVGLKNLKLYKNYYCNILYPKLISIFKKLKKKSSLTYRRKIRKFLHSLIVFKKMRPIGVSRFSSKIHKHARLRFLSDKTKFAYFFQNTLELVENMKEEMKKDRIKGILKFFRSGVLDFSEGGSFSLAELLNGKFLSFFEPLKFSLLKNVIKVKSFLGNINFFELFTGVFNYRTFFGLEYFSNFCKNHDYVKILFTKLIKKSVLIHDSILKKNDSLHNRSFFFYKFLGYFGSWWKKNSLIFMKKSRFLFFRSLALVNKKQVFLHFFNLFMKKVSFSFFGENFSRKPLKFKNFWVIIKKSLKNFVRFFSQFQNFFKKILKLRKKTYFWLYDRLKRKTKKNFLTYSFGSYRRTVKMFAYYNNKLIAWATSGSVGLKGKRRVGYFALADVLARFVKSLSYKFRYKRDRFGKFHAVLHALTPVRRFFKKFSKKFLHELRMLKLYDFINVRQIHYKRSIIHSKPLRKRKQKRR